MKRRKEAGWDVSCRRAGGAEEDWPFIDGNQTGLDEDEADVRSLQRHPLKIIYI